MQSLSSPVRWPMWAEGDSLPVFSACGGADFEVGSHAVASLVLWKVWLSRGVPGSEAAVANALGEEDLLAVVV
eukprot:4383050-Prymnesium_polylepis.1